MGVHLFSGGPKSWDVLCGGQTPCSSRKTSIFLKSLLTVGWHTWGRIFGALLPVSVRPFYHLLWMCCSLVFRTFSEEIIPYVLGLLCPWEEVNSGSSYATILNCLPLHTLSTTSDGVIIFPSIIKYNFKTHKKDSLLYLPLFLPIMMFFSFWSSESAYFTISFLFREFSIYEVGLLSTNSSGFPLSEISWFLLHSWRLFLRDIEFRADHSFLSVILKSSPSFCFHGFW